MNSLEAALNLKFTTHNSGQLLTVFTGNVMASGDSGLHWDIAPSECVPPYLVGQVVSAPMEYKFGGVTLGEVTIMFKSFAVGRRTAIANLETFISIFDEFTPTLLTSGRCSGMWRESDPIAMKIPQEETSGADEYQAITTYRYAIEP